MLLGCIACGFVISGLAGEWLDAIAAMEGDMKADNGRCFRFQGELIRQIQASHGESPCFGLPTAGNCDAYKEQQCLWSHDCHHEAAAADMSQES